MMAANGDDVESTCERQQQQNAEHIRRALAGGRSVERLAGGGSRTLCDAAAEAQRHHTRASVRGVVPAAEWKSSKISDYNFRLLSVQNHTTQFRRERTRRGFFFSPVAWLSRCRSRVRVQ